MAFAWYSSRQRRHHRDSGAETRWQPFIVRSGSRDPCRKRCSVMCRLVCSELFFGYLFPARDGRDHFGINAKLLRCVYLRGMTTCKHHVAFRRGRRRRRFIAARSCKAACCLVGFGDWRFLASRSYWDWISLTSNLFVLSRVSWPRPTDFPDTCSSRSSSVISLSPRRPLLRHRTERSISHGGPSGCVLRGARTAGWGWPRCPPRACRSQGPRQDDLRDARPEGAACLAVPADDGGRRVSFDA
ncbi:unnamed protein product [Phaeothamnion confervicola]